MLKIERLAGFNELLVTDLTTYSYKVVILLSDNGNLL